MENQEYEHLELRPVTVVKRKKLPFAPRGRVKGFAAHAAFLSRNVSQVSKVLTERMHKSGTKSAYLTLKTYMPLSDQALRQVGLVPVEYRGKNTIIATTDDPDLFRFRSKLAAYQKGAPAGKDYVPMEGVFGNIQALSARTSEDKLGPSLRYVTISPSQSYTVDIHVLPHIDPQERASRFQRLRKEIAQLGGRIVDQELGHFAVRTELRGQGLISLLESWDDLEVDGVPLLKTSVGQLHAFSVEGVEIDSPDEHATGICIIDSGIDDTHPFLSLAHKGSRSFHDGADTLEDLTGHGTKVAGLAIYGDVQKCIKEKRFQPDAWVCSAKIIDPDENGEDTMDFELLPKKLRRIVDFFRPDCRVFNLSVSLDTEFNGIDIPDWVEEIDRLSREYDVLFITCTGNVLASDIAEHMRSDNPYPHYLEEPRSRVYPPGIAANAICVGAITHTEKLHRPVKGRRVIAGVMQPSPFSRTGPGLNEAIKPDVCEVGGNMFVDKDGSVSGADPHMGIPTTIPGNEELFSIVVGTSFAAPRVANLAARLFNRFSGRTTNLIRALLVNSTILPMVEAGKRVEQKLLNSYGYGIPKAERALFSTRNRVTFIYEGEISADTCEVFAVPIPKAVNQKSGAKFLSVTLAYDPDVNHLQGTQYLSTELGWKLAKKGTTLEQVVRQLDAELESEEDTPDESGRGIWWSGGQFGSRVRSKGTVQKDTYKWVRGADFEDLYLAVISRRRWAPEDSVQRFALVVTFECDNPEVDVYTIVQTRTKVRPRVKLPVRTRI